MLGIQYYKRGSKSANLLHKTLNEKLNGVIHVYKYARKSPIKINWGSTKIIKNTKIYLNHPILVKNIVNKIKFLSIMKENDIPHVKFTMDKNEALNWLKNNQKVVARKIINGAKGKGIKILRNENDFIEAPLYTKYIPKRKEYRVIIVGDKPVIFMRKFLKKEVSSHTEIRNAENYNFLNIPDTAIKTKKVLGEIAKKVVKATKIDFCAIDIIFDLKTKEYLVLEANSAFGLGSNNADIVANEIIRVLKRLNFLNFLRTSKLSNK